MFPRSTFAAAVALISLSATPAFPYSLSDDFSAGINPLYWTPFQTTPGLYSIDATQSDIRIAKVAPNPGGFQNAGLRLNLAALGGSIAGDFSLSVQFSNAILGPAGLDQVELHTAFHTGGIFFNVRDNYNGDNVHVWDGFNVLGRTPTSLTSGTLTISRSGDFIYAYLNSTMFWSHTQLARVTDINFALQNNLGSNDAISVTFDNFSLSAADLHAPYLGDFNLDGLVDNADLKILDTGFANHLTTYFDGDITRNGVIDYDDYALFDATLARLHTPSFAAPPFTLTTIPEPAPALLFATAAAPFLHRRPRRPR